MIVSSRLVTTGEKLIFEIKSRHWMLDGDGDAATKDFVLTKVRKMSSHSPTRFITADSQTERTNYFNQR